MQALQGAGNFLETGETKIVQLGGLSTNWSKESIT